MNVTHFVLSILMIFCCDAIFCSDAWAGRTQIKVSGANANAILAAYRYTLTDFPDNGASVKNVRCHSIGCEYEFNNQKSSSTGTMIDAKEMANMVLRCTGGIASELKCQSSANFVVSCIATCQNN